MPAIDPRQTTHPMVTRRDFLRRTGWTGAGMTALVVGAGGGFAPAQPAPAYPDWIPASPKPPKRGGTLARASAWDPPVIDPRLTQSVGLFQFATLTSNRLVRYPFADEAAGTTDLGLKGDLAESWQSNADARVWTFKLRQGVKWQNLPPLNGRELVAADVKYCFEAYAKEGVQAFTFQEIEAIETPDRYTLRVHLKTPNTLFAHNVAEPVTVKSKAKNLLSKGCAVSSASMPLFWMEPKFLRTEAAVPADGATIALISASCLRRR